MQPPNPSYYLNRGPELIGTCIETIGSQEPNNREALDALAKNKLLHASLLIGRGCVILVDGNDKAANRYFRRAQSRMQELLQKRSEFRRLSTQAAQLQSLAAMLEHRDDPEAAARYQQELYDTAMSNIEVSENRRAEQNGNAASYLSGTDYEYRKSALLSRYRHPWLLAAPALIHRDQGKVRRFNYDYLVIESGPDRNRPPIAHKTQLKSFCLAFCGEGDDQSKSFSQQRAEYMEDIVLVSGHCDTGDNLKSMSPERLLLREYTGESTAQDTRALDIITDGLLLAITSGDPRRYGTQPAEPTPPLQLSAGQV